MALASERRRTDVEARKACRAARASAAGAASVVVAERGGGGCRCRRFAQSQRHLRAQLRICGASIAVALSATRQHATARTTLPSMSSNSRDDSSSVRIRSSSPASKSSRFVKLIAQRAESLCAHANL